MSENDTTYLTGDPQAQSESHQWLQNFWPKTMNEIKSVKSDDFKSQELPLARIKKIMKLDEDVKMISQEAPLLFAKAAEIFISELALRSWVQTEDSKRRTLQRNDISLAITKFDQFDFLIDIVPRDVETKPSKRESAEPVQYYVQTQTGISGVTPQALQLGQGIQQSQPLQGSQVVQVQAPASQQAIQQIQLTPSQLQAIQAQLGSGQQIVVQTTGSGDQQAYTVAAAVNNPTPGQQVQYVSQS